MVYIKICRHMFGPFKDHNDTGLRWCPFFPVFVGVGSPFKHQLPRQGASFFSMTAGGPGFSSNKGNSGLIPLVWPWFQLWRHPHVPLFDAIRSFFAGWRPRCLMAPFPNKFSKFSDAQVLKFLSKCSAFFFFFGGGGGETEIHIAQRV